MMPSGDEPLRQFAIIVDFAIEHDPYRLRFVRNGLVTGTQVDDAEATHAGPELPVRQDPLVVGAPVGQCATHRVDHGPIRLAAFRTVEVSGYPTHPERSH